MTRNNELTLSRMMRPEMRTRCIKTDHLSSNYYCHNYWFSVISKVAHRLTRNEWHIPLSTSKHYFFSIRKLTFVNYGAGFHLPLLIYSIY